MVWSFSGSNSVSSFRTATPSKQYTELLEKVQTSTSTLYHLHTPLQALSFNYTLTPWTTANKSKPKKEHRRVRMEGTSESEEEKADTAQEKQAGEELTSDLSKNEIKRMRKAQRRKEVNHSLLLLVIFYDNMHCSGRNSIVKNREQDTKILMRYGQWRRPLRTWETTN